MRPLFVLSLLAACHAPADDADTDGGAETDTETETDTDSDTEAPVSLVGSAQKGPFLTGSTLLVSALDESGAPTGAVYPTTITDDLGDFSVTLPTPGFVLLQASGYWYDEVRGELSGGQLTLRAYYDASSEASPTARVNLATHLASERVRALVEGGETLPDAISQADAELVAAVGIGPAGFDPGAATSADLLGDDEPSAWLFALSAVVVQAAITGAGAESVDAHLQKLDNDLALDLADDGAFTDAHATALAQAERALAVEVVEDHLAAYVVESDATATVPALDTMIDSDGDDVVNATDNCRDVPNADQEDDDLDGIGDACQCGNGDVDPGEECDDANDVNGDGCNDCRLPACGDGISDDTELCLTEASLSVSLGYPNVAGGYDMDGDGHLDLVLSERDLTFVVGDGAGGFGTEVTTSLPKPIQGTVWVVDLDDDGDPDVLAQAQDGVTVELLNDGAGTLSASTLPFRVVAVGDFDGGGVDVLVGTYNSSYALTSIDTWSGNGDGSFDQVGSLSVPVSVGVASWGEDLDGDGYDDAIASSYDAGLVWYRSDGIGGLSATTLIPADPCAVYALGSPEIFADVDEDGLIDVLGAWWDPCGGSSALGVYLGADPTSFTAAVGTSSASYSHVVTFDPTRPESVVGQGPTSLMRMVADASGTLTAADSVTLPSSTYGVFFDVDEDGDEDFVASNGATGGLAIWTNEP